MYTVRTRDNLGVDPLSPVEMGSVWDHVSEVNCPLLRGSTVVSWIQVCIVQFYGEGV